MDKKYLARTIQGLEDISASEIKEKLNGRILLKKWRLIEFTSDAPLNKVCDLKSVNDIFLKVGYIGHSCHKKEYLDEIRKKIPSFNWGNTQKKRDYFIVASIVGKHNYSRFDVENIFKEELSKLTKWSFRDHAISGEKADVTVRIMIEDNALFVGLSFCPYPLRKRSYKVNTYPGTLNPTVAYAMCQLAKIDANDVILDPMCGMGTIPIEACISFPHRKIIGLDIDRERIECAKKNAQNANARIFFEQYDATNLSKFENTIDVIISNLPWGRQIVIKDIADFYEKIMKQMRLALVKNGRCILLISDEGALLEAASGFNVQSIHKISLSGDHPSIIVLRKC